MKLIFKGIVQGVGFRPTIYRIAKEMGLKGYVLNKGSEVEVFIDKKIDEFIAKVKNDLPSIAKISSIEKLPDNRSFKDFTILHSTKGERQSPIPVDIGICNDCLKELFSKDNRRYQFPFTNCTVCGARYSLIEDVPYDRERTSMDKFKLCQKCNKEYKNPLNRRYHAQTISCPNCGPKYQLYDKNKKIIERKNPIEKFADIIDQGKIGVIKTWGGMHLCCNINEIEKFRKWYKRPQKPFAIMVRDIETANKYGNPTADEEKLLKSKEKPVVLIEKNKADLASPGIDNIGLFLPYTGLHHLLFESLKSDAVIMTSANIPGEPMLILNNDAFSLGADIFLLHNRRIPNRVDDSVIKIWKGNTFFLRKSRGFIPDPLPVTYDKNVLTVGAGENIIGTISSDFNIYATQYIGNSKYYSVLEFLEESLRHLMKLFMKKPRLDAVVQDLHPGYDSRKVAKIFSEEFSVPLFEVQHHWAHGASLQVEKKIDEIVVLAIDGLGYGTDGTFWGGEVLYSNYQNFKRIGHLENISLLGGDQATRDPRRLVYGIFKNFDQELFFKDKEAIILSKMIEKAPKSSSLGRILDAISCYLGICCSRTYDGEPAIKLERYLSIGKPSYCFNRKIKGDIVGTIDLFRQLDEKIKKPLTERQKADYAFSMVKTIVDSLSEIAINYASENNIKSVGVSGGVSYNIPIIEMIEKNVQKSGLKLIVHNRVPNGDGCIGIGQNAIIGNKLDH